MKGFEGITISKSCPKAFSWRGISYNLSKMDQAQAERLADDPEFTAIQRKKKKAAPAPQEEEEKK